MPSDDPYIVEICSTCRKLRDFFFFNFFFLLWSSGLHTYLLLDCRKHLLVLKRALALDFLYRSIWILYNFLPCYSDAIFLTFVVAGMEKMKMNVMPMQGQ
ncbi:hypothetical protein J1N35_013556 [Gossypium stocksii]|uniref:Uncharacterized protein n=1 Tax=Gossypium stocksii TaxID=47602 RepID=A0A9D4A805_9ROSI|nr:hypothetical protein J1N35_013556 [Gossypium stocksii]